MKLFIDIIICIVAAFVFLPAPGTTEIRNVPLLIIFHIFIFARIIFKLAKRVSFASKVRSALQQKGLGIVKSGISAITAEKDGVTYNVKLIIRKNAHISYYFKDESTLEFYKTNRLVVNSVKAKGASATKYTETKRTGFTKKLKWAENVENMLVIDKFPAYVNDSVKKEPLGSGEKICGKVSIYDYDGLSEFLKNE
jgi:hypothetical protein